MNPINHNSNGLAYLSNIVTKADLHKAKIVPKQNTTTNNLKISENVKSAVEEQKVQVLKRSQNQDQTHSLKVPKLNLKSKIIRKC